ncbi:MAG: hypothetical protein WC595_04910 [Candidatus Nanoarchaeia archaeon]
MENNLEKQIESNPFQSPAEPKLLGLKDLETLTKDRNRFTKQAIGSFIGLRFVNPIISEVIDKYLDRDPAPATYGLALIVAGWFVYKIGDLAGDYIGIKTKN